MEAGLGVCLSFPSLSLPLPPLPLPRAGEKSSDKPGMFTKISLFFYEKEVIHLYCGQSLYSRSTSLRNYCKETPKANFQTN